MSDFISVIILVLAMLISASMQLVPSTFSIFYHYALGKTSFKKADDRSLSFITGVELFIGLTWFLVYIILLLLCCQTDILYHGLLFWAISGILVAESILILFFYFGHGTTLFISRRTATALSTSSRKAKSRQDGIVLGFCSGLPELIFTLPLYIISAIILLSTSTIPRAPIVILYIIFSVLPLFVTQIYFRTGHNLAGLLRLRLHLKPYLRIIISLAYFLLAIATLNLGVLLYGR